MKKIIFLFFAFLLYDFSYSQNAFIPEPTLNVISDFEKLLTEEEIGILAYAIKGEYNSNSNQLMIVTIPTSYLGNLQIEDYAQKLFEKWQPGQKDLNNGILMIIVGSKMDSVGRKLRIHTGYGVQGVLPDLLCSRIEKAMMVPELKKGNYFKAIKNGSTSILNFISKENVGKIPQYKIEVQKSADLVYDYARVFTDEEKKNLEAEMNSGFNAERRVLITDHQQNYNYNYVYISKKYSYDTTLFKISFNPGYYTDEKDSILKFSTDRKTYYLSFMSESDEYDDSPTFYKKQKAIEERLASVGPYTTIMELIADEKVAYAKRLNCFIYFISYLLSISVFVFIVAMFTKNKKGKTKTKKPMAIKIPLGIILVAINLYSFLSLVTFEMLYYFIFSEYICLSGLITVLLMILLAVSQVVNVIYVYKIDANYFNSKLFSWMGKGGGGSSYSNSSDSSSSSNSSSSSSSSNSNSSSNGGYYGGGGTSGGGGASSDW
ncbi:MAG: TPM domain-containing protein [Bacteroidetes bacterium]|nr:TPM domain-containing protein [Bacteroidota bacterium]